MASRVQKIMFCDTFKNAKSVIFHFFPVAEIGSNIHLLYFSYEIYSLLIYILDNQTILFDTLTYYASMNVC